MITIILLSLLALYLVAALLAPAKRPLVGLVADARGLITPANLAFWFTKLDTQLGYTYSITPTFTEAIASMIPSSTEQNGYAWIGRLDKFRLWQGARNHAEYLRRRNRDSGTAVHDSPLSEAQ